MAAVASAAYPATAQNSTQPPVVITPPAPSFSLSPGTPTPAPTATPSPAVPPPVVVTTPAPEATPTAAAPAASRRPQPRPTAEPPAPAASAGPAASPSAAPPPSPSPIVSAVEPTPAPAEIAAPAREWWPWAAGLVVLLVALGFVAWRRLRKPVVDDWQEAPVFESEPALPAPEPPLPAAPIAPPPLAASPQQPLTIDFRPLNATVEPTRLLLELELTVTNTGAARADGVRPVVALTTAGPDLAAQIAGFGADPALAAMIEESNLAPGEQCKVVAGLELPRDAMHVANAGGRAIIVPVALVAVRWRGGLSIKSLSEAHLIGTGEGAKLTPLWLSDTPRRYDRLAARRFTPPTP